jgi:hypothetical protein
MSETILCVKAFGFSLRMVETFRRNSASLTHVTNVLDIEGLVSYGYIADIYICVFCEMEVSNSDKRWSPC